MKINFFDVIMITIIIVIVGSFLIFIGKLIYYNQYTDRINSFCESKGYEGGVFDSLNFDTVECYRFVFTHDKGEIKESYYAKLEEVLK